MEIGIAGNTNAILSMCKLDDLAIFGRCQTHLTDMDYIPAGMTQRRRCVSAEPLVQQHTFHAT